MLDRARADCQALFISLEDYRLRGARPQQLFIEPMWEGNPQASSDAPARAQSRGVVHTSSGSPNDRA